LDHRFGEFTAGGLLYFPPSPFPASRVTMPDPNNPGQFVPVQFAPDGTLVPFKPGTFFSPALTSGGDGFKLSQTQSLRTPVDRFIVTALAHVDVLPGIRLSGELNMSHVEAVEPTNQGDFNTVLGTGNQGALQITPANPFLSNQARAII